MGLSFEAYKFIHIVSIVSAFSAMAFLNGRMMAGSVSKDALKKFMTIITHTGLLIALISGWGMYARLGLQAFPGWPLIKTFLNICAFLLMLLLSKKPEMKLWFYFILIFYIAMMAALGIFKPF